MILTPYKREIIRPPGLVSTCRPRGLPGHHTCEHAAAGRMWLDEIKNANAPWQLFGRPYLAFGAAKTLHVNTPWDQLIGHSKFTFAAVVYVTANTAAQSLSFHGWSAGSTEFRFYIDATEVLRVAARSRNGGTQRFSTGAGGALAAGWHTLLVTVDLNATPTAWVDGVAYTMGAWSGAFDDATWQVAATPAMQIAGYNVAVTSPWLGNVKSAGWFPAMEGSLAEAVAFHARPEMWLAQKHATEHDPAVWMFSEGTGATVAELSAAAGKVLDITGATWAGTATSQGGNRWMNAGGVGDSLAHGRRWFGKGEWARLMEALPAPGTGDWTLLLYVGEIAGDDGVLSILYAAKYMRIYTSGGNVASVATDGAVTEFQAVTPADLTARALIALVRSGNDLTLYYEAAAESLSDTDDVTGLDISNALVLRIGEKGAASDDGPTFDLYRWAWATQAMTQGQVRELFWRLEAGHGEW